MAKKPNKHSQRVTPLNNEPDNFKFQEKVKTDSNLELDSYYGPQSYSKKIQINGESWHGGIKPIIRVFPFD